MDHARRRALLAAAACVAAPLAHAQAAPFEVHALWPQARLVGSGRLRFLGLRVYDARLWAPAPVAGGDWAQQPFALELIYARAFEGAQIAQRSLDEMRRQGEIERAAGERWLAAMRTTFPDVREGDRLTGLHHPGEAARFFHNGQPRGDWRDADLTRRFFGIWLAPQTSEPALRVALLGG